MVRILRVSGMLLLLAACSGPDVRVEVRRSRRSMPAWARGEVPAPGGSVYFLGSAEGASSLEEGRKQAMAAAMAAAAAQVAVRVSQREGDQVGEGPQVQVDAVISRAQQDDIYTERLRRFDHGLVTERWNVYLLLRVPRLALREERERQVKEAGEHLAAAVALAGRAQRLMRAGRYMAAHTAAQRALVEVAAADMSAPNTVQQAGRVREVARRARDLALGVAVLAVGGGGPGPAVALRDELEAGLSAGGMRPVPAAAADPRGLGGGGQGARRSRLARFVKAGAAQVLVAVMTQEREGVLFGKRSATVRVKAEVFDPSTGDPVLSVVKRARGFGATLDRALVHAATEAARKVVPEVLSLVGKETRSGRGDGRDAR